MIMVASGHTMATGTSVDSTPSNGICSDQVGQTTRYRRFVSSTEYLKVRGTSWTLNETRARELTGNSLY